MPDRTYSGPAPAVDVHMPDGTIKTCEHGKPEGFPAEVAESLDRSGDWLTPKAAKSGKEQ